MRRELLVRSLTALAVTGLTVAVVRCAGPERAAAPPAAHLRPLSSGRAAAAVSAGLLPRALPAMHWMAEIHTAAMQEGLALAHGRKLPLKERCVLVAQVIRAQLPAIKRASGVDDDRFYERVMASAESNIGCAGSLSASLSIWRYPFAASSRFLFDSLTGAYATYEPQMESAMLQANTPDDAAAGINATLSQASSDGIGSADFQVLSAIASLGASSAYYWYAQEQAGDTAVADTMQASIFRKRSMCGFWCHLGWSDVVGTFAGAAAVIVDSGGFALAAPPAVAAGALLGGVAGSLSYAVS